ncbi:MAG TPA: hypothetical protein VFT41_12220 [Gemmatimonadaceae bacterium]|nr:hypothetical protein [Gemmatimonadaceae bacterium]
MDALITAAAQALSRGDPIGALNRVALRNDPPALALRGIAMAQLGDLDRAKVLLRDAARAFGAHEPLARARCTVALAEVALASRDLRWPTKALDAARQVLDAHNDAANAAYARLLAVRRLLLIGQLDDAQHALDAIDAARLPPASAASHGLLVAGIAIRRIRATQARDALIRAERSARDAGIPALAAEVSSARTLLNAPAMRVVSDGTERAVTLGEVERTLASDALVVDACRYLVHRGDREVHLVRRPVLFGLARALAEAWPGDASRETLLSRAFGAKFTDDSHRARLRVEIGRLRRALGPMAGVRATTTGFVLVPARTRSVKVLVPAAEERHAPVLALLGDGEAWSSSALALALGAGQRTVQRALDELAAAGKVQALGRGRARRWVVSPGPGFTTPLLLPVPLPGV